MTERADELLAILASMVRVRRVEERLSELFTQGKIPGFIHVSIGQEAVPAGVCSCLERDDAVLTTHRGHGHAVAKGIDLKRFMAEIFGRRTGFCKGRSGSMHVADPTAGVMGANGIVGGGLPIALGTALASQYRGEKTVTVCFFGDGASNEGTFHESLNIAALWSLPVLFCCENNDWAQFTPQSRYMKVEGVARRADSYGMPGVSVDGSDVLAVRRAAAEAVARARRGEGPTLLECKVRRWFGHYVGDPQKYRPADDVKAAKALDPIERLVSRLAGSNALGTDGMQAIESRIQAEIDAAVAFAAESPPADPADLHRDVYA
ncbi:MAG TPA: thiamine pyrophosphate-dependent dehydrogenase E1 component subunit alpha [Anaeromyxobacter sp.]